MIEVLEANWTAVQCYQSCEWTCVGVGMAGLVWTGISAQEMETALRLHQVPVDRWQDTVRRIRVMVVTAREHRNQAAKRRA